MTTGVVILTTTLNGTLTTENSSLGQLRPRA